MLLRVMFSACDLRQPHRRRSVRKGKPNKDDASEGDRRRNKESQPPINYHEIAAKNYNQSAADRMRDIPDRHATREFPGWKPMRQQTRPWPEAPALKPTGRHRSQPHP